MPQVSWAARTDVGRRRAKNEDAFIAVERVFAVADGMGGHAKGEVASAMAVEALGALPTVFQRTEVLEAIREAHTDISRLAADTDGAGMGTTLTGIAFEPDNSTSVLVFNVGDSRVYRLREGRFDRLTHDHSVVQELIDAGEITEFDAEQHPDRHIVTRSLGDGGHLDIEWSQEELQAGDRFLVCSDGLCREVADPVIAEVLGAGPDLDSIADRLLSLANDNGGRDNVTVAIVDVGRGDIEIDAIDISTTPRDEVGTAK